MDRRKFLSVLTAGLIGLAFVHGPAIAKSDSGSGGSGGGGSGNSGSGGGDSGSGSSGGDDDDSGDDNDDHSNDDDSDKDRDDISDAVGRGEALPLQKVLKAALANTPGKVVDVKLRRLAKGFAYRVKILSASGRKRELLIDAKSLRLLRIK